VREDQQGALGGHGVAGAAIQQALGQFQAQARILREGQRLLGGEDRQLRQPQAAGQARQQAPALALGRSLEALAEQQVERRAVLAERAQAARQGQQQVRRGLALQGEAEPADRGLVVAEGVRRLAQRRGIAGRERQRLTQPLGQCPGLDRVAQVDQQLQQRRGGLGEVGRRQRPLQRGGEVDQRAQPVARQLPRPGAPQQGRAEAGSLRQQGAGSLHQGRLLAPRRQ